MYIRAKEVRVKGERGQVVVTESGSEASRTMLKAVYEEAAVKLSEADDFIVLTKKGIHFYAKCSVSASSTLGFLKGLARIKEHLIKAAETCINKED